MKKYINFSKLSEREILFISLGIGIITALILGEIFCRTNFYSYKNARVPEKFSKYSLCEFNYVLAVISFILSSGGVYFFLKQKGNK